MAPLCRTTDRHRLSFFVIVPDCEVFLKVLPGLGKAVLCLGRDHAADHTGTGRACCVSPIPTHPPVLLNLAA
jgi:hypothetical protein